MNHKSRYISSFFLMFALIGAEASENGSSQANAQLCPPCLSGLKEMYVARLVGFGWAEFSIPRDGSEGYHREAVSGLLYKPEKKISLKKPFSSQLERRIIVDQKTIPIGLAPAGYFVAYGSDASVWLITVERGYHFVVITRLKRASDDPEYSKLYWEDLEDPHFESQSRYLGDVLKSVAKPREPVK